MSKKEQTSDNPQTGNSSLGGVSKRAFVNVYEDDDGRFIGDEEYSSYDSAFKNRDDLSTYRETVEIVRRSSGNWKFCNTKVKSKTRFCSDYYCPKCGSESGLVNIIGLCATKVSS